MRVDERSKWGLAEGFDYKYYLNGFGGGLLRTYYTNQRNVDRNEIEKAHTYDYKEGTLSSITSISYTYY